ncbi:MAG: amidohydrolase [Burkholderiaceae bacterium]|nr:amidohydrolase [Sulfuritalea sp.]MCF8176409.1 amidohydrolase [Burkholderiaceae bacterium]MCF8185001.1 amidohydrolase [Polynucleobacter sp.]
MIRGTPTGWHYLPTLIAALCAGALPLKTLAADPAPLPIFDAHLHYNWEPVPYYSLEKVLALFRQQNVTGILATSRPNDGTRALYEAKPKGLKVVPFIRPYRVRADIQTWMDDPSIQELIETEYKRGYYVGIGEFHLSGKAAASQWVRRTVNFAVEKNLYLHAHADDEALEILFAHNSDARIIWAHTGFSTAPEKVAAYLERHRALWCELSYRQGIAIGGKLTAEWKALFERYPDRFLLGSDTWVNERWDNYGSTLSDYRSWLAQLPRDVAEKIAFRNAERLFAGRDAVSESSPPRRTTPETSGKQ